MVSTRGNLSEGSDTFTNHVHLASKSTPNQLAQITNQFVNENFEI